MGPDLFLSVVPEVTVADLDESQQKAFDFSQDSAKQLITLSTAVLALTITFFKDFAAGADETSKILMAISWLFYLVAVVAGAMHLYALTAELDPKDRSRVPTIYSGTARATSGVQQLAFIVGLGVTTIAGVLALQ
jgi:hypothetical protein